MGFLLPVLHLQDFHHVAKPDVFDCKCKSSHRCVMISLGHGAIQSKLLIFCHRSDWFLYCIWHLHGEDGWKGQAHDWVLQHPQWDCDETCHHDHVVSITWEISLTHFKPHWFFFLWSRNNSQRLFLQSLDTLRERLQRAEIVPQWVEFKEMTEAFAPEQVLSLRYRLSHLR